LSEDTILKVQRYLKNDQRAGGGVSKRPFINLFVKQFPRPDFNEDDLRKMFEPYGEILSAIVMRNQGGFSLGFGFVCFTTPEAAQRAL
jgi:polyadenylate-binding protein